MARPLRIEYEGAFYHVTARGNERRKIFLSASDCLRFLAKLSEAIQKYHASLHAYVLMGNHYHLILETPQANLSAIMQMVNSSYTTYFNVKRKRFGHLFQGRYKAILIDADSYLLELSRYIHLNPVRAGVVEDPADYVYSSYRAYASNKKDPLVTKDKILSMISQNPRLAPQRYTQFVRSAIGAESPDALKQTYGGMILGSKTFIKNTLERIKSEALESHEVSNRKALQSLTSVEEIVKALSEYFEVPEAKVISSAPYKAYAVYLSRKHTTGTNAEIGRYFGISYSAVTKVGTRLKKRAENNRKLEREMEGLEARVSRVKG